VEVDIRYANPITGVSNSDNISKTYSELNLTKNSFEYGDDNYSGAYPNKLMNLSDAAKSDNSSAKTNLKNFKDWLKTNRLMMEIYYNDLNVSFNSNNIKIYFGKEICPNSWDVRCIGGQQDGFLKMMQRGSFYKDNSDNTTGIGVWDNNTNTEAHKDHYNHWHITAPINRR
jgi:hypothetical protein